MSGESAMALLPLLLLVYILIAVVGAAALSLLAMACVSMSVSAVVSHDFSPRVRTLLVVAPLVVLAGAVSAVVVLL